MTFLKKGRQLRTTKSLKIRQVILYGACEIFFSVTHHNSGDMVHLCKKELGKPHYAKPAVSEAGIGRRDHDFEISNDAKYLKGSDDMKS